MKISDFGGFFFFGFFEVDSEEDEGEGLMD